MHSGPCVLGMKINEQVKQNHVKQLVGLLFYKLKHILNQVLFFLIVANGNIPSSVIKHKNRPDSWLCLN